MNKAGAHRSAFDTAVDYLTYKDRTISELKTKLSDKGYDSGETDDCIRLLKEYGYLDDAAYSRSYIRANSGSKGMRRIRLELIKKGVDKSVISGAATEEDCDETASIVSIMNRRYGLIDFSDEREIRRMYSFFARRGFLYEDIRRAENIFRQNIQIQHGN